MSILAALTGSMGDAEPIATRGLGYLLQRYPSARASLHTFLANRGLSVPEFSFVRIEDALDKGGRVDISCRSADSNRVVLLEGKFWAGLTEFQPGGYLAALGSNEAAALVFVAPDKRFSLLAAELSVRVKSIGYPPLSGTLPLAVSRTNGRATLCLTSWRALLGVIRSGFDSEGNLQGASDLEQILGLADLQDNAAFLPLRLEELSDLQLARRHLDFVRVALSIAENAALTIPAVSTAGLRVTSQPYGHGRYLRLGPAGGWVGYAAQWWREFGCSPVWLSFVNTTWGRGAHVRHALRAWEAELPPRLFVTQDERTQIPIMLPPQRDFDDVVAFGVSQIRQVCDGIASLPSIELGPPPEIDPISS